MAQKLVLDKAADKAAVEDGPGWDDEEVVSWGGGVINTFVASENSR